MGYMQWTAAVGVVTAAAAFAPAMPVTLYDGAAGTLPQQQGWLAYQAVPEGPYLSQAAGATTLNTSLSDLIFAGFSNYAPDQSLVNASFPVLDRESGFSLHIDLRINSEAHATDHRAGFSVIVLGSDRRGIELGFWTDRIWAQNDASAAGGIFTRGETADFNTTAGLVRCDIGILGDVYTLTAGGEQILSGAVRDYTSWEPPMGLPDPYELSNFIFAGDNTTSARGSATFSHISVVPEPAMATSFVVIAGLLLRRRRV
jgi:hypothetical protein